VRGARRRRALDRGFVLSDHADWPGLMQAIEASGARRVIVTHGFEAAIVRHLSDRGIAAHALRTEFGGEAGAESAASEDSAWATPLAQTVNRRTS